MRLQLALLLYLSLLDALTTRTGLGLGFVEVNAIAVVMGDGMYAFKALATGTVVLSVLLLRGRYPHVTRAVHIGNGILAAVVGLNLAQLAVMP